MKKNKKLAYFGGTKIIKRQFKEFNSYNNKEVIAARKLQKQKFSRGM